MPSRDRLHLQTMIRLIGLIRAHLDGVDEITFTGVIDHVDAVATRNFLAHNYDEVSPARLWGIVQDRLSPLEAMCRAELGE